MIEVENALKLIAETPVLTETEIIPVGEGSGRILAQPVIARVSQPPANMSAMDGYAARQSDCNVGARLKVIGEAPAGRPFEAQIGEGECVRVFTGSVIPSGADHVIIQEDTTREGDEILITDTQIETSHVRQVGLDFSDGEMLVIKGKRLLARHLSLCAAANNAHLTVYKRPKVAVLSSGDELRPPGSQLVRGQIIASNEYSLMAMIREWGGNAVSLGIVPDQPEAIRAAIMASQDVDVFVPVGGASVGDYDYLKSAFADLGYEAIFTKVAVKPGKPTWFSKSDQRRVLGLPGNPSSMMVCANLFLRPLIARLMGQTSDEAWLTASLSLPLPANGPREAFLRGRLELIENARPVVRPASNQDSSLLKPFLTADVLIRRAPNQPTSKAGDIVHCLRLS